MGDSSTRSPGGPGHDHGPGPLGQVREEALASPSMTDSLLLRGQPRPHYGSLGCVEVLHMWLYFLAGLWQWTLMFFRFEWNLICLVPLTELLWVLLVLVMLLHLTMRLIAFAVRRRQPRRLLWLAASGLFLATPAALYLDDPFVTFRLHLWRNKSEYLRIAAQREPRHGVVHTEHGTRFALGDTRLLNVHHLYFLVYEPGRERELAAKRRETGRYFTRRWDFEFYLGEDWYLVGH